MKQVRDSVLRKFIDLAFKHTDNKVLAHLAVLQAIHESAWGHSELTKKNNNLFGIKGRGRSFKTKEHLDGKNHTVMAEFKAYYSWAESFKDYFRLLETSRHYTKVRKAKTVVNAIQAIHESPYATDPNYGAKLLILHNYLLRENK